MDNFKTVCHKISDILSLIIGYALMICLFVGGLGVIGYIAALIIGGDKATEICVWIYGTFYPWLIKLSTYTTVLCFLEIYFKGDANWKNPFKSKKS